jgi:hypothetical protein
MADVGPLQDSDWPDRYELELEALGDASSEEPFLMASFELLKEAAGLIALALGVSTDPSPSSGRNHAVLIGHLVRMVKLMRTEIRSIVDDHGGDQQMQIVRQFLDSASALAYFFDDISDTSRVDAYVNDSLIGEREFLADVLQQITDRGGKPLPIEIRIQDSIARTFETAAVAPEDLPSRRTNNWPSAQERLKLLGPTAYSAYRMGSGSIHGSWHDLERSHLNVVDGVWEPDFKSAPTRPQPLFAMALVGATMAKDFVSASLAIPFEDFDKRTAEFLQRLRRADEVHEQYLMRRSSESGSGPD